MVETRGGSTSNRIVHHNDQFNAMDEMVFDAFRPYRDVLDVNTNMRNDTFSEDELPNEDAKRFYDKLISTNKPIYEGATQSMFSICVQLLAIRSNWHVPQKGIDVVTKLLKSVCLVETCLPNNYYQVTQLVSKLGLKVEKIDCCKKECILYYKDDNKLSECKICHSARLIPRRTAEMRWHHENKKSSNVLRHPSYGKAWKHFDDVYPDLASDPKNLRLGLCSDGFTPYIQASASPYSCWPVILTPYNLPPEMCMTKPYLFLTCLIPGPSNPKQNTYVYLQPLIDDLQRLWSNDILTYDISTKQNFIMKACLIWTINDFPAYGMLSGWGTQEEVKEVLQKNRDEKDGQPYIYTWQEISEVVSNFPKVTEIGWKKKLNGCLDVEKGTIHGMKSHDCHVFMESLLPIAFHSLPKFVWKPLTELSRFFKDLCCNTLRLDNLVKLNDNISMIICKLERIFPPGFFDSMEHLPIHLAYEAMLGGIVHYQWMYPFESLYLENHSINEEDTSRRIHAEFPIWLKAYVNNEANEVTNKDIIALSRGPSSMAISWNIYFVNGYTFHTKAYNINKKTINSGVHVRGLTEGGEDDYYGTINYIIELDYFGLKDKVALFYCEWFDPTKNWGTKIHPQYQIVDIKMDKRYRLYDPFILVQKSRQVYYVTYP
ncbi:uncharacterized protein [Cicer arietinum]|uniref:uncharacterized protein n=1 Tax=Cicer arietinum TaxID=3827 RepID=UPI003CC61D95